MAYSRIAIVLCLLVSNNHGAPVGAQGQTEFGLAERAFRQSMTRAKSDHDKAVEAAVTRYRKVLDSAQKEAARASDVGTLALIASERVKCDEATLGSSGFVGFTVAVRTYDRMVAGEPPSQITLDGRQAFSMNPANPTESIAGFWKVENGRLVLAWKDGITESYDVPHVLLATDPSRRLTEVRK